MKVLSRVFRGKFVAALKRTLQDGRFYFHGNLALLAEPKIFAAWLRPLFRKEWWSHETTVRRPSLCSSIWAATLIAWPSPTIAWCPLLMAKLSFAGAIRPTITNRSSCLYLSMILARFLLHLLPQGFVRIRNFGFLANRKRASTLPLCFQLLGAAPQTEQAASSAMRQVLFGCPQVWWADAGRRKTQRC